MARTPPPEFPVRTYPSPVISDQVLIEWITSELANSSPLEPGAPHPNTRDYSGFKLGIQRVNAVDPYWTQRVWVTDAIAEDVYNWAQKYSGDNVSYPIFIRAYRELKLGFSPRARGSALQTVWKLTKVLSGSGYTPGTQPALMFAGGGGSGAAGHAVVAPDGTITEFVLTATGSGYTSAPTFTCAAPTSGVTATGTASIQPTGAILVSEDAQQFPPDSEFFAQYFNVLRVYETLPGPLLPFTRYDDLLGPIQGTRRAVVNSGQAASLTATAKTTYEARDGSSYVAWQLIEDWSANGGYPITYAKYHDDARGEVSRTTQLEVKASQTSSSSVSGSTVTQINYTEFDQFHYKKVVETWTVPRTFNDQEYDKTLDVVYPVQRKRETSGTSIGTAHTKVTSQGDGTDITETIDPTAIATALNAYSATFPTTVDLSFPPQLTGIDIFWEISTGNGDAADSSSGSSSGDPFALSLASHVEAQGSASVMPEIIPHYKIVDGSNCPAIDYYFFLANPVTMAAVLTKVSILAGASVTAWPRFNPDIPTFVLQGQKASASVHANARASVDDTSSSFSTAIVEGDGLSQDFGSSIGSRTLERCIHGSVGVDGDANKSQTFDIAATASADVGAVSATGGPRMETIEVIGSISPTGVGSTSGATSVPGSGLRLKSSDVNMYGYGFSVVRARVVDFASL